MPLVGNEIINYFWGPGARHHPVHLFIVFHAYKSRTHFPNLGLIASKKNFLAPLSQLSRDFSIFRFFWIMFQFQYLPAFSKFCNERASLQEVLFYSKLYLLSLTFSLTTVKQCNKQ